MIYPEVSSSSAYDPESYDRPALNARVHALLSEDEIAKFSITSDVQFRSFVSESELEEIRQLHYEWFPVLYNDEFYNSIVTGGGFAGGDVITVVACMKSDPKKILGLITIAIRRNEKQYNPAGDLMKELGYPDDDGGHNKNVAYILTLGVVDELRRKGVGKVLLDEGIRKVEETDPNCIAVFLHVIEYNKPAMKFYLRQKFVKFSKYDNFYFFDDKIFSGILFYRRVNLSRGSHGVSRIRSWIYTKLKRVFEFLQIEDGNDTVTKKARIKDRVLETVV